jgi:hypothetical protein
LRLQTATVGTIDDNLDTDVLLELENEGARLNSYCRADSAIPLVVADVAVALAVAEEAAVVVDLELEPVLPR